MHHTKGGSLTGLSPFVVLLGYFGLYGRQKGRVRAISQVRRYERRWHTPTMRKRATQSFWRMRRGMGIVAPITAATPIHMMPSAGKQRNRMPIATSGFLRTPAR